MFEEIQNEHHTNYAGINVFSIQWLVLSNLQFLVCLLTVEDYLIEAPKYELISRIEINEKEIRSKSECEIQSFIRYLNDKGKSKIKIYLFS